MTRTRRGKGKCDQILPRIGWGLALSGREPCASQACTFCERKGFGRYLRLRKIVRRLRPPLLDPGRPPMGRNIANHIGGSALLDILLAFPSLRFSSENPHPSSPTVCYCALKVNITQLLTITTPIAFNSSTRRNSECFAIPVY